MPSQYVTAPEVYMGTPYGPSADVYSLGRLISYMKYKAWRWRGIEALDRLEAACVNEDPDMRPTAEEIVAALSDRPQARRSVGRLWGRGAASGGGGGYAFFSNFCLDEGVEEGLEDVNAAGGGAGGDFGGSIDNGGGNALVSLSPWLKTLGRRVVQTVQYAFFGMVLRPGWFVTSMGGGGGGGGDEKGGEGDEGEAAQGEYTTGKESEGGEEDVPRSHFTT